MAEGNLRERKKKELKVALPTAKRDEAPSQEAVDEVSEQGSEALADIEKSSVEDLKLKDMHLDDQGIYQGAVTWSPLKDFKAGTPQGIPFDLDGVERRMEEKEAFSAVAGEERVDNERNDGNDDVATADSAFGEEAESTPFSKLKSSDRNQDSSKSLTFSRDNSDQNLVVDKKGGRMNETYAGTPSDHGFISENSDDDV